MYRTKTPAQLCKGDHVTGSYFGVPFAGTIWFCRAHTANWRKTLLFIRFDKPIRAPFDERPNPRNEDSACLTVSEDGYDESGACWAREDTQADYWPNCDTNEYPRDTIIYTRDDNHLNAREQYKIAYRAVRTGEHTGNWSVYWLTTGIDHWDGIQESAKISYYDGLHSFQTVLEYRANWRKLAKQRRYAKPEQTLRHLAEGNIRDYYRQLTWHNWNS